MVMAQKDTYGLGDRHPAYMDGIFNGPVSPWEKMPMLCKLSNRKDRRKKKRLNSLANLAYFGA